MPQEQSSWENIRPAGAGRANLAFHRNPPHSRDVERAPSSGTCPAGKYIPCYCRLIRPFWETEGCSRKGN